MNSPAMSGQKINGKKAASVVNVEARTGTNIFWADNLNTSSLDIPHLSFD